MPRIASRLGGRRRPVAEARRSVSHQEVHESESRRLYTMNPCGRSDLNARCRWSNGPEKPEIDADLATTLGRPKVSMTPTGKLGRFVGWSGACLVPESVTGEGGEGDGSVRHIASCAPMINDQVMSAWADLILDLREKNKMGMAATLATGGLTFEDPRLEIGRGQSRSIRGAQGVRHRAASLHQGEGRQWQNCL